MNELSHNLLLFCSKTWTVAGVADRQMGPSKTVDTKAILNSNKYWRLFHRLFALEWEFKFAFNLNRFFFFKLKLWLWSLFNYLCELYSYLNQEYRGGHSLFCNRIISLGVFLHCITNRSLCLGSFKTQLRKKN